MKALPVYKMPHLRGWPRLAPTYPPSVAKDAGRRWVSHLAEVGRIPVAGHLYRGAPDGRQVVNFGVDYKPRRSSTRPAAAIDTTFPWQGRAAAGVHVPR